MNNLAYIKSTNKLNLYNTTVSNAMEICLVIVLYILVKPVLFKRIFKSINSIRRRHIIRQTIPNRNYPVCIVKLTYFLISSPLFAELTSVPNRHTVQLVWIH